MTKRNKKQKTTKTTKTAKAIKPAKKCKLCNKEATFFHSGCCCAHFEGKIINGKRCIVCEVCGKFMGEVRGRGEEREEGEGSCKMKTFVKTTKFKYD